MTNITNTTLKIADIRLDGGTQPRVEMNQEVVDEYAERMQEEGGLERFPGVTVFHDGDHYWLADGFHRIFAARQAEIDEFQAMVHEGSQRDAILYSIGANAHHGLRRSNEDKRASVLRLLSDDDWAKWSDHQISRWAGVSQPFVSSLRRGLTENGFQSDERVVRRGDKEITMNTANIAAANAERARFRPDPDAHWFDNYYSAVAHYGPTPVLIQAGPRFNQWLAFGQSAIQIADQMRCHTQKVTIRGNEDLPAIKLIVNDLATQDRFEEVVDEYTAYQDSARELIDVTLAIPPSGFGDLDKGKYQSSALPPGISRPGMPQQTQPPAPIPTERPSYGVPEHSISAEHSDGSTQDDPVDTYIPAEEGASISAHHWDVSGGQLEDLPHDALQEGFAAAADLLSRAKIILDNLPEIVSGTDWYIANHVKGSAQHTVGLYVPMIQKMADVELLAGVRDHVEGSEKPESATREAIMELSAVSLRKNTEEDDE